MITYSTWKSLRTPVTNLLLDANNPRIPGGGRSLGQRELLSELIHYDDVYRLAQGIAENGYYPDKSLVVIRGSDKKCVVLEGNRRCAALKALLSPSSAPQEFQARFKKLALRILPDLIRTVPVCVAPSREDAWPFIIATHTTKQIEEWSPAMKARIYASLFHQGQTPDEIADSCRVSSSSVKEYLRNDQMYQVACNLDLPADVEPIVHDARKFPLSTFERLFSNKHVQDFLGFEFEDGWLLKGRVQIDEFKKGLNRLVCDIARNEIDSRKINNVSNIVAHLGTFGRDAPDLNRDGTFMSEDLLRKPSEVSSGETQQEKSQSRGMTVFKSHTRAALIPKPFRDSEDPRLHGLLTELKKLPVGVYPFGAAVLLRTLVETALENFLICTGEITRQKEKKGFETGKKSRPLSLSEMLVMLAHADVEVIKDVALRRQTSRFCASSETSELSVLNQFVHNRLTTPSESEVRCLWDNFQPLISLFLEGR